MPRETCTHQTHTSPAHPSCWWEPRTFSGDGRRGWTAPKATAKAGLQVSRPLTLSCFETLTLQLRSVTNSFAWENVFSEVAQQMKALSLQGHQMDK